MKCYIGNILQSWGPGKVANFDNFSGDTTESEFNALLDAGIDSYIVNDNTLSPTGVNLPAGFANRYVGAGIDITPANETESKTFNAVFTSRAYGTRTPTIIAFYNLTHQRIGFDAPLEATTPTQIQALHPVYNNGAAFRYISADRVAAELQFSASSTRLKLSELAAVNVIEMPANFTLQSYREKWQNAAAQTCTTLDGAQRQVSNTGAVLELTAEFTWSDDGGAAQALQQSFTQAAEYNTPLLVAILRTSPDDPIYIENRIGLLIPSSVPVVDYPEPGIFHLSLEGRFQP